MVLSIPIFNRKEISQMFLDDKLQPTKKILRRTEELEKLLSKLRYNLTSDPCRDISRSNVEIKIKNLPGKLRDLEILWYFRDNLPTEILMEIIERRKPIPKLPLEERRQILQMEDRIWLYHDENYLKGRVQKRAEELLENLRIYLNEPPRPRTHQRIRGYRDKGCLPEYDKVIRQKANSEPRTLPRDLHREYLLRQQEELEIASRLLKREREGATIQDNVRAAETDRQEQKIPQENRPFQNMELERLNQFEELIKFQRQEVEKQPDSPQKEKLLKKLDIF